MRGRPKKQYGDIHRPVYVELSKTTRILMAIILVVCPICGSALVGSNGTRRRKNGRVESFMCHNPDCPFREAHHHGKQFVLTKSGKFRAEVNALLGDLYEDLVQDGAKYSTIAHKYGISTSEVAALRSEFQKVLDARHGLEKLVAAPVFEKAVAIDETFLKIEGTTIYVIIATGYATHEVLGVRVSESRKEEDMKAVIDEAEQNTVEPPKTYTSDAHGATAKAIKNLGRPVTHVIHRHKKPYNKAVIRQIEYTDTERVITDIGVKTDVFTEDGKREYRYMERREPLQPPAPKPRGRPKGSKNGPRKKKKKGHKKRRARGLFAVFKDGMKGYLRVNLVQHALSLAAGCAQAVVTALENAFELFAGMSIQNNLAETINGVLGALTRPRGPRTAGKLERKLRAVLIVRNDPSVLAGIHITRQVRGTFFLDNAKYAECGRLAEHGWELPGYEKIEGIAN
jgi:hypothetical protein